MQGITEYQGKELEIVLISDIFELYIKIFGKPVERRTREKTKAKTTGQVYIIGNLEYKTCKIGYSENPNKRVKDLQTGCPFLLTILASFPGNVPIEKQIHRKYAHLHLIGEWFTIDEVLLKVIQENDYYKIKPKK